MRHRLRRQAAALLTVAGLALSAAVVPSAVAAAPAGTATPAAPAPTATAPTPSDPTGGKSVVGQTSPIHDPALVIDDDGTWYVFSTGRINRENGGTIQIATSTDDGTTWTYSGTVWDTIPTWIDDHYAGGTLPENLWAPEVYVHDGTYYLYYSASQFGGNNSITGLATNTTLDPADPDYEWVDQGLVISSPVTGLPDGKDFNAIDAGIVEDDAGNPYMAIGSFWYGIFLVPLEWPTGKAVADWQSKTVHIADRFMAGNPIEAPYITKRDGFYYLFVSFGACCQGASSTYQVAVGRSTSVEGPYLDRDGRDMFGGGGTILLDKHGAIVGPGGQSVAGDYLAFHYYDASNAAVPYFPTLGIQKLAWVDGWPVTDQSVELSSVTTDLSGASAAAGSTATFTLTATGSPAPVAEWETSADAGLTWTAVTPQPTTTPSVTRAVGDSATSTLTLAAVTPAQDGLRVRARVSNAHGSTTSTVATLTVTAIDPGPGEPVEPGDGETTAPGTGETTDPGAQTPPPVTLPGAGTDASTPAGTGSPSAAATTPPTGREGPAVASASTLARTGSDGSRILQVALALMLIGGTVLTVVRRRTSTSPTPAAQADPS